MIKKERGALTYISQEINALSRENTIAGMHLIQKMDEKMAEKLQDKTDKGIER